MKKIRLIGLLYSCVVLVGVSFATNASAAITNVNFEIDPPDFWTAEIDLVGDVTITGSTTAFSFTRKIFTTDGLATTFRLDEFITNDRARNWSGWHESLQVPDGQGGWTFSHDDGLLFESVFLNSPSGLVGDFQSYFVDIIFSDKVRLGESISITKFITVPLGMTEFALYEMAIPTIPVPASVWLFGSGLVGLIGVARKKSA